MVNTDAEKIAQIEAAIIDYTHSRPAAEVVDEIGLILAEPGPAAPPYAIDRDALTEVIYECGVDALSEDERLATAVTDVKIARQVADAVLALARPVEGVTLTPEEARVAASALRSRANELRYRARINPVDAAVMGTDTDALRSLAARLEEASE